VIDARGHFHGPDAEPFEAHLLGDEWAINTIKSGDNVDTIKHFENRGPVHSGHRRTNWPLEIHHSAMAWR
jgi:hypothetical protein